MLVKRLTCFCIFSDVLVYLMLKHIFLFVFVLFLHLRFTSSLISVSLPPDLQVYTADGSPQSRRNVSGETAHTLAVESCDRGMLFMFNSLKV